MLGASGLDGITQNQAEEVRPEDSQNATDNGADQALEANDPQACFEEHHAEADYSAGAGCLPALEGKRPQHKAGNRHYENKDKTYEKKVHKDLPK